MALLTKPEPAGGIYMLIETAKQTGIAPATYLAALFEQAPRAASPDNWEKLLKTFFRMKRSASPGVLRFIGL